MADAGRYALRLCEAPAQLGIEAAVVGVLYEGPHGPAYFDAANDRIRVRGAVNVEYGEPLLDMSNAVRGDGLSLTVDGRRLLMRRRGRGLSRSARAIVVFDGDRELLSFRLRRWSAVSMERPDGTVISEVPKLPPGAGKLVADAQSTPRPRPRPRLPVRQTIGPDVGRRVQVGRSQADDGDRCSTETLLRARKGKRGLPTLRGGWSPSCDRAKAGTISWPAMVRADRCFVACCRRP